MAIQLSGSLAITGSLTTSGQVGIGTSTPSTLLHLKSTGAAQLRIEADSDNVTESEVAELLLSQDGAITTANFSISDSNNLVIGSNSTTSPNIYFGTRNDGTNFVTQSDAKLTILNNGNVGIGTTTPGNILEISGTNVNIYPKVNRSSTSYEAGWKLSTGGTDNWYIGLRSADGVGSYHFYSYTTNTSVAVVTNSGDVGIGTSTPGYKLDVNGNVRLGSNIYTPTDALNLYSGTNILVLTAGGGSTTLQTPGGWTGNLNLQTVNAASSVLINTNGSNRITVLPSGNVGIGTTSPLSLFTVNGGTVNLTTYTSSETRIADGSIHLMKTAAAGIFEAVRAINSDTTIGTTVRLVAAATSDPFNNTNGGKVFIDAVRTSTNMDLVFSLNDVGGAAPVERVRFTGGGAVGIGTTAPSQKLETVGIIKSSGVSNSLMFENRSASGNTWEWYSQGSVGSSFAGLYKNYNTSETVLAVTDTGNVGIGTTSPSKRLHVRSGGNEGIFMEGTNNGGHWFDFKSANSNLWSMGAQPGIMGWYNRSDSSYKMVISDGGNVGIGTTSPGSRLEVNGNIYANGDIRSQGIFRDYQGEALLQTNTSAITQLGSAAASTSRTLAFLAGNAERMRITTTGDVGIGTTAPTSRLFVSGSTNVLAVQGSGSVLMSVDGTNGRLFEVTDDLSNSLFSANTIAGLPVIEAFADYTVNIGTYNAASGSTLSVTGSNVRVNGTIVNTNQYKANTFIALTSSNYATKTFTFTGATSGTFPVTDFSGVPSNAKALLVYGWYHIKGYGLGSNGQGDHATSWFGGDTTNTAYYPWAGATNPWPGDAATFQPQFYGSLVLAHDGDASFASSNMLYYGFWDQGIVTVRNDGNVNYYLGFGLSGGTHYNALYCVGYWI